MELNRFSSWIDQSRHLGDFFFQIVDVGLALRMIEGDDGGAPAKPTKRLAEWNVEIQREVAIGFVVLEDFLRQIGPGQCVGEFRGGWIRRVARAGDVILLHQIQIYFKRAH